MKIELVTAAAGGAVAGTIGQIRMAFVRVFAVGAEGQDGVHFLHHSVHRLLCTVKGTHIRVFHDAKIQRLDMLL